MARRFSCVFVDRQTSLDRPSSALNFVPRQWSQMNIGGPDSATIEVNGPPDSLHEAQRLLGDTVSIFNEHVTKVWFGFVNEVEINYGATTVNVSLESMANRIAVIYTDTSIDGSNERKTTDWAQDADSIAKFGIKELRPSFEGTETEANAFRASELLRLAWPVPVVRNEDGNVGGTVYCKGHWHKLGWQYYQFLGGLEEYSESGNGEEYIGTRYTNTTISFSAEDDILDSASNLGTLDQGDKITIAGAASAFNNGEFTVGATGAGTIEVVENTLVTAAAGASITISLGGPRIDRVAQSFTLSQNTVNWPVATIAVRAYRVGAPVDNFVCQLCSDSGGSPGTVLEEISIVGSTLPDETSWVEFTFANTTEVTYATLYWIVISRSSPSIQNYYILELNEEATYAGGQVKVHNGTTWSVRDPAADMPFRIASKLSTTFQALRMIQANSEFAAVSVLNASNVFTWQYRDGDSLASDEVADLIALGRSTGQALQVDFLETRHAIIKAYPAATDVPYIHLRDGTIRPQAGAPMPPGQTIAGVWVYPEFLPPLDVFKPATALFVAASEYDAVTDRLNFETDGSLSVYRGRRIQTG